MTWHDGQPVTVDDVIFSFQAPAGDDVADVQAVRRSDRIGHRRRRQPGRVQAQGSVCGLRDRRSGQGQPDSEARLGAGLRRSGGAGPQRRRSTRRRPRSGPVPSSSSTGRGRRRSSSRPTRTTSSRRRWAAGSCATCRTSRPRSARCKAARSTSSPSTPATRRCSSSGRRQRRRAGDGRRRSSSASASWPRTSAGRRSTIRPCAAPWRRPSARTRSSPTSTRAFATIADSHVSKALEFWHAPDLPDYADPDIEGARAILEEAGYSWDEEGFLLYPEGQTETIGYAAKG